MNEQINKDIEIELNELTKSRDRLQNRIDKLMIFRETIEGEKLFNIEGHPLYMANEDKSLIAQKRTMNILIRHVSAKGIDRISLATNVGGRLFRVKDLKLIK